jgi:predicted nucleic acid-binding protein
MNAKTACFTLDTNILVYSVDSAAAWKHEVSCEIVYRAAEYDCLLMLQAVSEFFAAVTRKNLMPRADAAAQAADWLDLFPTISPSTNAVRAALEDAAQRRASYWDALIVASASEAGCTMLLTEDLQHGTELRGVEIHNPFTRGRQMSADTRALLGLA